jgi:hypothetical protein
MTSDSSQPLIARIERLALCTAGLERPRGFYTGRLGALASPLHEEQPSGRACSISAASDSS